MILIVTNKSDLTADFLILELIKQRVEYIRFNTEDFPEHVELSLRFRDGNIHGYLRVYEQLLNIEDITSIWYRRPRPSEVDEEVTDDERDFILTESRSTLDGLWKILDCKWVSHPDRIREAESKIYQLKLASQLGFTIPQTIITNSPEEVNQFYNTSSQPIIYKTQRRSYISGSDGVRLIYTSMIEDEHVQQFHKVKYAPSTFQSYINKQTEFRVTVVGNTVLSVELRSQDVEVGKLDWRMANLGDLVHIPVELPSDINKMCVEIVRQLGLSFGAIDLILTPEGRYIFLEINPNGQWAWVEQICPEIKISQALINLLVNG